MYFKIRILKDRNSTQQEQSSMYRKSKETSNTPKIELSG